jgi:hypothetical protein
MRSSECQRASRSTGDAASHIAPYLQHNRLVQRGETTEDKSTPSVNHTYGTRAHGRACADLWPRSPASPPASAAATTSAATARQSRRCTTPAEEEPVSASSCTQSRTGSVSAAFHTKVPATHLSQQLCATLRGELAQVGTALLQGHIAE